ncbi:hypothetical protein [Ruminococcus bromii]|uniref:hypothetical protein n=1 Tax=Ruminococcus bromii TaxID=40518 RepID=UPI002659C88F|nr:hypothetical protein [Ruminococcus bromii]
MSSNVIIRTIDDNVNRKINNITQSQQFKRWFGDWQNKPQNASKAVDGNGEPLVLYHQTEKEFTTYASIKNPLIVNNRSELVNFYDKNVQGYTKAKSAIDTARENITEQTEVKNGEKIDVEKFSIADDIVDNNGTHYGKGVVLDTKIFKNKKPRDWGKILKKFVYDNLAGKQITVFDKNNNERVIEFARLNERVKKDGANNPHKVIDKLARKTDNNSRLAVAHSSEIVEVSNFESNNPTHTHQWLDENGWEYRNVYLINRKGEIYKATLNIGKSKDGRNILYDINKISNIGHGAVFSNGVEKIDTKRNSLINLNVAKTNVSQNIKNVNEKFSLDEDYDFSDPSKLDERELKIYNNRGWSYGLFNKEDMALLSEKVQELKKDWHKADNALWDGSRLVEINNKLVILGGTYKNPEIYNVLVINANQETDAEFIKEDFYFEFNRCKKFREVVANICKSIEIMQGEELVRFYDSIDCIYKKGRGRNWIPATLPSDFKDYGYTEGRNERYGSSFRTGKSVSSVQLNEETDNSTDEKVGAIHDTLKFSIDEEYDDWLVNDDGKNNINDLIKEAVALETTGKTGFFYLDKKEPRIFLRSQGTNHPADLKIRVPISLYAVLTIMSTKRLTKSRKANNL